MSGYYEFSLCVWSRVHVAKWTPCLVVLINTVGGRVIFRQAVAESKSNRTTPL